MPTKIVIKKNTYFDSVSLMSVWEQLLQKILVLHQGKFFFPGQMGFVD
ncbi:hypothetical protein [Enterobacter kobei]